ncbi:lamin tail domain-containing protein [Gracilimonas mengyeensis]|uniref:Por secretion system C-terminal sorting domain-containing protein n=1 Tax=Gracilimonas mengyeensis TaxID=1302730 RepID=A0A521CN39_9BACT|nr:lamin tail domain-containing protein [Gracilimonas mengyeensis]SMO60856.1 Por secretion system C-terminal sorting domain-containing protein [Gracilimonas mengyeensis]
MKHSILLVLLGFAVSALPAHAQIKINEIVASNGSSLTDEQGEADDWVEIFNAGEVSVNFGGMYVTDDPEEPLKWQIPSDQSNQTTIGPGEYLVLWFDGDPEQGALHVDTKLSASGEYVILTDDDGVTRIDSVAFPELEEDIAWGRNPDGSGAFTYLNPTPLATNSGSELQQQAEAPSFTLESGFYSSSLVIGIEAPSEDAQIRYTIGGGIPTTSSTLYEGPITIDSSAVLRAIAIEPGKAISPISTNTYLFGDSHTIPVVTFVMDPDSLFGEEEGMYVIGDSAEAGENFPFFGANFWEEWERPVHIEYLNRSGSVEFEFDGGASIGGNFSRGFPKKSFIINNNSSYGIDELDYDLFPENDYTEYDGFGLRAGAEERSRLLNELMYTINQDWNHHNAMQAYQPVVLYLNGQYWGVYNLQERKNDDFVESRFGYDDIDMIKDYSEVKDGNYESYDALLDLFQDESLQGEEFFAIADSLIDLQSFTDHWVYQVYTSHGDPNNLRYWRPREAGGKWRYISHDFDWWKNLGDDWDEYERVFTRYLSEEPAGFWIIGRMMENETYREMFLNRLADMMNTAFEPSYMLGVIDSIDTAINPEMPRDTLRWSDGWFDIGGPTNYDMEYTRDITEEYVVNYPRFIYTEIRDTLQIDTLVVQLAQTSNGTVQLNSITPNTVVGDWTGVYFENTSITLQAHPEPGYELTSWMINGETAGADKEISVALGSTSIEIEATFGAVENDEIVINEINYNSSDDINTGDWVELFNYSSVDIDLSGWTFRDEDDEHAFVIPDGVIIAAQGYLVLSDDTAAFRSIHPNVPMVDLEVDFGLGGGGDQVRIFNSNGVLIDRVEYTDDEPWPTAADGEGYTLALLSYELDNALAESWGASDQLGGTPGRDNWEIINSTKEKPETPRTFSLQQNYPNPFNPTTVISYELAENSRVKLKVFDMLGREVATLVNGDRQAAGQHQISFDARNLSSGVYIYRLTAENFSSTMKMILLK